MRFSFEKTVVEFMQSSRINTDNLGFREEENVFEIFREKREKNEG